jgi:hypothetical protein
MQLGLGAQDAMAIGDSNASASLDAIFSMNSKELIVLEPMSSFPGATQMEITLSELPPLSSMRFTANNGKFCPIRFADCFFET